MVDVFIRFFEENGCKLDFSRDRYFEENIKSALQHVVMNVLLAYLINHEYGNLKNSSLCLVFLLRDIKLNHNPLNNLERNMWRENASTDLNLT